MTHRTGYHPLNTLKLVAQDLWVIDGPVIKFYGLPFTTRATVLRLKNGGLFVHSPTKLTEDLVSQISGLGEVRYLIAPSWVHYAYLQEWQEAFPEAESWVAPGVTKRAKSRGISLEADAVLESEQSTPWQDEMHQMVVPGSKLHREAVFFHKATRTLILTDLIQCIEGDTVPVWMRILTRVAGIAAPRGGMPPDLKLTFDRAQLRPALQVLVDWAPERVIFSHGAWFQEDGTAALKRALGRLVA